MSHAQKRSPAVIDSDTAPTTEHQPAPLDPKRWLVLAVIAVCQLRRPVS
jgi:hypothetical protein